MVNQEKFFEMVGRDGKKIELLIEPYYDKWVAHARVDGKFELTGDTEPRRLTDEERNGNPAISSEVVLTVRGFWFAEPDAKQIEEGWDRAKAKIMANLPPVVARHLTLSDASV